MSCIELHDLFMLQRVALKLCRNVRVWKNLWVWKNQKAGGMVRPAVNIIDLRLSVIHTTGLKGAFSTDCIMTDFVLAGW